MSVGASHLKNILKLKKFRYLSQDISPPDNTAVLHHLSMAAHYYYSDNRAAARWVQRKDCCAQGKHNIVPPLFGENLDPLVTLGLGKEAA